MFLASFSTGARIARLLGITMVGNGSSGIRFLLPYVLVLLATCALIWLAYLGYRKVRAALGKV